MKLEEKTTTIMKIATTTTKTGKRTKREREGKDPAKFKFFVCMLTKKLNGIEYGIKAHISLTVTLSLGLISITTRL